MLKVLQTSTWTEKFQMCKLDLEKAEEPEVKLPTSTESQKKQGNSGKASPSALLTTFKPLTVWISTNCGKFLNRWEYQTTLPTSWETCMQVKKQQLDWFQIGKGVCQGYILSPCLFNLHAKYIMQNVWLNESQAGINNAGRNINNLR